MTAKELRQKYLDFFVKKGHKIIPPAPLVPKDDLTTLFTSSGMQPLVSYLKGEPHRQGKRLTNSQPSLRLQDIDEVGDMCHTTFFEMLGNWSLGDYFKEDQLHWIFEFLTDKRNGLGLDPRRLYVSVFDGDENFSVLENGKYQKLRPDVETIAIWKNIFAGVGIDAKEGERIFPYPSDKNWWSRSGTPEQMPIGEVGGPDSEIFFDLGKELKLHENSPYKDKECHPNCQCGRFSEIGNSVFIQYEKKDDNLFIELSQKNVDFGGGLERLAAATNNNPDIFQTDLLKPIILKISEICKKDYFGNEKSFRIITDHIRASVFLSAEGVVPRSDDRHGAVLRRLLDRTILEGKKMGISGNFLLNLGGVVVKIYKESYPLLEKKKNDIENALSSVESRVEEILVTPSKEAPSEEIENLPNRSDEEILIKMREPHQKLFGGQVEKYIENNSFVSLPSVYAGTLAFWAKTTEGRPVSSVEKDTRGSLSSNFNEGEFYKSLNDYFEQHKKISREAGAKLFKGGLADHSEIVTKYHTATHLLNAALRQILGPHVFQKGSNITAERLRFDFQNPRKLTEEELKNTEELVNQKIKENLPVKMEMMSLEEAKKMGAATVFEEKYGEKVKVYKINGFSVEVCGGPHVDFTGKLGKFKIRKEEAVGAGVRRLYAVLE